VHFGLTPNAAGRFGGPRAQARFFCRLEVED
jgi:hypothetical protein